MIGLLLTNNIPLPKELRENMRKKLVLKTKGALLPARPTPRLTFNKVFFPN